MKYTYPSNIKTPAQRKAYRAKVIKEQTKFIAEIWNELVSVTIGKVSALEARKTIRDKFIITRR